jgi:acyl carrier protein
MPDIKTTIRTFIIDNFLFGDTTQPLAEDTSLIEADLVDSTGILELVAFLEDQFGFTIADAEIVPANLDAIASISAFVMSKTGAETHAA